MKFKYRVKGKVNSQMVLRGMFFKVGAKIDFCVSETELNLVKANCSVDEIIDLEPKAVEIPDAMLNENENKPKGGDENVNMQPKLSRNSNKRKSS